MSKLDLDQFKAKMQSGGARANRFDVKINFPGFAEGDAELASFMCKGAQLPSSIINPIEVAFRGRKLQLAGDRTFEPWTITVYNDGAFKTRDAFEKWMNGINEHVNNTGIINPSDYMADLEVSQLDLAGNTVKTYQLKGAWPTNVGQIEVSYDSENTIEEFTVELQMQYWTSNTTT